MFRVGDIVCSKELGMGRVVEIKNGRYGVRVKFDSGAFGIKEVVLGYTRDGYYHEGETNDVWNIRHASKLEKAIR